MARKCPEFSKMVKMDTGSRCRMQKLVALLALLLCKCRKPVQSLYLYHLANRATLALLALYLALLSAARGAEVSSHKGA
jgi:hypothetical protein